MSSMGVSSGVAVHGGVAYGRKEPPTAPELVEVAGWHMTRCRVTERKVARKAVLDALEVRIAEYVERAGQPPRSTS